MLCSRSSCFLSFSENAVFPRLNDLGYCLQGVTLILGSKISYQGRSSSSFYIYSSTLALRKRQLSPRLSSSVFFLRLAVRPDLGLAEDTVLRLVVAVLTMVDLELSFWGVQNLRCARRSVMTQRGMQHLRQRWKQQLQQTTYIFSWTDSISSRMGLEAGFMTLSIISWQMPWRSAPRTMLKSIAQVNLSMQYLPKRQIMSENEVARFIRFSSLYTRAYLCSLLASDTSSEQSTILRWRQSRQGSISFVESSFSKSSEGQQLRELTRPSSCEKCWVPSMVTLCSRRNSLRTARSGCFCWNVLWKFQMGGPSLSSSLISRRSKPTRPYFLRYRLMAF